MPTDLKEFSKIREYQDVAASKNQEAAGMVGASFTLGDKVMEAVRTDRLSRGVSKLATDTGNVMGQMVTDPNQIREGAGNLVDPFSINALTSGARAQNLRTLGTVGVQGEQNRGSIGEVVQAGANQLKARAASLQAEAEKALASASALEGEFNRNMETMKFNEGVRQFNTSQANSGGSGKGDDTAGIPEADQAWLNSYMTNLSDEDKIKFKADLASYSDAGYDDKTIKTFLDGDYSKKRFTPTQATSAAGFSTPTKQPLLKPAFYTSTSGLGGIGNAVKAQLKQWFGK